MKPIDITGERFGHLVAIRFDETSKPSRRKWICQCDCGKIKSIRLSHLRSGATISCGCKHYTPIHGKTGSRIYEVWVQMKQRCSNPHSSHYYAYGQREITVCQEWSKDFRNFYSWSIQNGYADNLTIDRINNEKGYSPDNCRWATLYTQANNRRNNKWLLVDGEKLTIAQAARKYGIDQKRLGMRIARGLSFEKAFEGQAKSGYVL